MTLPERVPRVPKTTSVNHLLDLTSESFMCRIEKIIFGIFLFIKSEPISVYLLNAMNLRVRHAYGSRRANSKGSCTLLVDFR